MLLVLPYLKQEGVQGIGKGDKNVKFNNICPTWSAVALPAKPGSKWDQGPSIW